MYTKEQIQELIQNSDLAVERAVFRLNALKEQNPKLMNEFHAKLVESLKVWLEISDRPAGKRFTDRILQVVRAILSENYTDELVKWANENAPVSQEAK